MSERERKRREKERDLQQPASRRQAGRGVRANWSLVLILGTCAPPGASTKNSKKSAPFKFLQVTVEQAFENFFCVDFLRLLRISARQRACSSFHRFSR